MTSDKDKLLQFAPESRKAEAAPITPWKILVVDDEEEVHRVTRLALSSFEVLGRPLQLIDAYTGQESVRIMREQPDIALILMDVVMETEHAGLDAVMAIRQELGNRFVRIILRTGQPGQAPELEVVRQYDINDYKEKTELTRTKLYTALLTGLSLYRELLAMEDNRQGLQQIIEGCTDIFQAQSLLEFQRGLLVQLTALLHASKDAFVAKSGGLSVDASSSALRICAATGRFQAAEGELAETVLDQSDMQRINHILQGKAYDLGSRHFVAHFVSSQKADHIVYLCSEEPFSRADTQLVELFCRHVAVAFDNLAMSEDLLQSKHRVIQELLATTGVRGAEDPAARRVRRMCRCLGKLLKLSAGNIEALELAAGLPDNGRDQQAKDLLAGKPHGREGILVSGPLFARIASLCQVLDTLYNQDTLDADEVRDRLTRWADADELDGHLARLALNHWDQLVETNEAS